MWAPGQVETERGRAWRKACGMMSAADARRPERAVVMRPGVPCRNMAAAVDVPDDVNGVHASRVGVNGPSAWGISPDGESGGVIQENGLPCRRYADFAMHGEFGFRVGKGQKGRSRLPGAAGKDGFSRLFYFISFFEWWLTAIYPIERSPRPVLCNFPCPSFREGVKE